MKKKFLEAVCKNRARAIFTEAVERFNYPTDISKLEELKRYCHEQLKWYNPVETELMKEEINKLIAEYKNRMRDYAMSYR